MTWAIYANDMRSPKFEMMQYIVRAETREALEDLIERELVPLYRDGRFAKEFRPGPLEWVNKTTIELVDFDALLRETLERIPEAPLDTSASDKSQKALPG